MDISEYLRAILEWTEKHAGLGGWVGAIGAVLAVFVTWSVARAEYLRDKRQKIAAKREEIRLLRTILDGYEDLLQSYVNAVRSDKAEASSFYARHMNDPKVHAANDLAHVPVTQWPSISSYLSFKRYWHLSIMILETSNLHPVNKSDLEMKAAQGKKALDACRFDLDTARAKANTLI